MNEVVSFGTTDRSAEPGHSCPLASAKRIAELLTSSERSEAAIYHQVNRNPPNFSAEREGDFWLTTADNTRGDSKLATTENEAIRVASALEFFPRQFAFRFDKRVRGLTHLGSPGRKAEIRSRSNCVEPERTRTNSNELEQTRTNSNRVRKCFETPVN